MQTFQMSGHEIMCVRQDVCWAGQTLDGALAELAGDRLGINSLSAELGGVSPIDLQAEPAGPAPQPDVLGVEDVSLRCCAQLDARFGHPLTQNTHHSADGGVLFACMSAACDP